MLLVKESAEEEEGEEKERLPLNPVQMGETILCVSLDRSSF